MRTVLLSCLLITACSRPADVANAFDPQKKADARAAKERAADARGVRAGFTPDQPEPLALGNVDAPETPGPGAILPAATEEYRYIGRWAPDAAQCAAGAWKFKTRDLTLPDGHGCDLPTVAAVPSGYELQGQCKGDRRRRGDTVKLIFDDRAKRMRVTTGTFGSATLLYCGP